MPTLTFQCRDAAPREEEITTVLNSHPPTREKSSVEIDDRGTMTVKVMPTGIINETHIRMLFTLQNGLGKFGFREVSNNSNAKSKIDAA